MSPRNSSRGNARFWVGMAVALLLAQVVVFLYLPVHFHNARSPLAGDFLIVFLVPLGGFAARLLHTAMPLSGWKISQNRWRLAVWLILLVAVAFVAGVTAIMLGSEHALRLVLANFAVALPLTAIAITENIKRARNGAVTSAS